MEPLARPFRAGAGGEHETYTMSIQEKQFMLVPASAYVAQAVASSKEFPPRGLPANYSLFEALEVDGGARAAHNNDLSTTGWNGEVMYRTVAAHQLWATSALFIRLNRPVRELRRLLCIQ
jgi:hypothetical protein